MPILRSGDAGAASTRTPEEIAHLEAALAIADEIKDGKAGYLIESALDSIRAASWPGNLDLPPRRK